MKRTFGLLATIVVLAIVADVMWTRTRRAQTASSPAPSAATATTPSAPPRPPSSGGSVAPAAATSSVVLRASWGSGPGQLGRRGDPESVHEGPMSLIVDGRGLVVLDNVNQRLVRFDPHGKPLGTVAIGSEAAQDLTRGARDRLAVLDRLRDKRVTLYDGDGQARARLPLVGAGVSEPAAVTGLFGDRDGELWIEREHAAWLHLADAEGRADPARRPAPGRPMRDGRFVAAAIVDRDAGRARVRVFNIDGTPAWDAFVEVGAPLLFIALVDGDAAGAVYLGAHTGRESASPPYRIGDEALTLVALGRDGAERARLRLPAPPPREESFRDLYVGDDGTIYWLRRTDAGVVVEAYRL